MRLLDPRLFRRARAARVLLVTHRPEGLDLVDEVVRLDGVAGIRGPA